MARLAPQHFQDFRELAISLLELPPSSLQASSRSPSKIPRPSPSPSSDFIVAWSNQVVLQADVTPCVRDPNNPRVIDRINSGTAAVLGMRLPTSLNKDFDCQSISEILAWSKAATPSADWPRELHLHDNPWRAVKWPTRRPLTKDRAILTSQGIRTCPGRRPAMIDLDPITPPFAC